MPKSKRDKKVSLTKVDRKGRALKEKIIADIKSCVENFQSIYIFTYENMRTNKMQDIRQEWKPSRFFFGKNKVIALGLGRTPSEEMNDGLHELSKCLKGPCGILFTNSKKKEVFKWFNNFAMEEYARSGFKVDVTIALKEGPLNQFSHSVEPYLRQLGMPTKLNKGVVTLIKDFEVCKEGTILTPEQAKILQLLEYKLAKFKLILKAYWINGEGFKRLQTENQVEADEMDDENN